MLNKHVPHSTHLARISYETVSTFRELVSSKLVFLKCEELITHLTITSCVVQTYLPVIPITSVLTTNRIYFSTFIACIFQSFFEHCILPLITDCWASTRLEFLEYQSPTNCPFQMPGDTILLQCLSLTISRLGKTETVVPLMQALNNLLLNNAKQEQNDSHSPRVP